MYNEDKKERILEILGRAPEILTLPSVVNEILDVVSKKNSTSLDLTKIIENDPALTSRILAIANSAYYGFVKKISTVSHAVIVLGFQEIQNIALSMSVVQLFDRKGSEFSENLWRHSFAVGVGTRMIAQYLAKKVDGKYFVSGLLHDVGKIFLSQYMPEAFEKLLSALEEKGNKKTYHALEESFFGITHAEVGEILLSSWMFPSDIVNAVAYHHTPSDTQAKAVFPICIHLADVLCTIKGISPLKDHHFIGLDQEIISVIREIKPSFGTEDMLSMISQLDIEIDRQSTFVTAFKKK
jgi:putative nucleotidyltransferase with HDIG domain